MLSLDSILTAIFIFMKCFVSYIQPELKTLLQTFIKKKKDIIPTNRKFMLESHNIIFFFKILFIFETFIVHIMYLDLILLFPPYS